MLTNFHTHSLFCDGKNSLEELLNEASRLKISQIGFSSHAPLPFDSVWAISSEKSLLTYCHTIDSLKSTNKSLTKLYKGLEADYIPGLTTDFSALRNSYNLDYIIGSVHLVLANQENNIWFIDGKQENYDKGLKNLFENNIKKAVTAYYEQIAGMITTQKFDIIAHFDKIKLNNAERFFSESDTWYRELVISVLHQLKQHNIIVEINTRGLYQKKRNDFYPSDWIISECLKLNIPVMVNSDAHQKEQLISGFSDAITLLKKIGYKTVMVKGRKSWREIDIKKITLPQ